MLTRMDEDGMTYADALAEAQTLGFAEADPTADVDGFDAANKIAILASIAFNTRVTLSDVRCEGIRSISPVDMDNARKMGYAIKLLAVAKKSPQGIDVRVHPAMVPLSHPLSTVNGVYNAIYVVGDSVGDAMFYGQGAGAGPAASAVVGDILEVGRRIEGGGHSIGSTASELLPILRQDDLLARFYIRMHVADKPAALASIADVLATCNVSILTMSQRGAVDGVVDLTFTTHQARIKDVMTSLDVVRTVKSVCDVESVIRIEGVE
jgi:homoserine dehydrogenase